MTRSCIDKLHTESGRLMTKLREVNRLLVTDFELEHKYRAERWAIEFRLREIQSILADAWTASIPRKRQQKAKTERKTGT